MKKQTRLITMDYLMIRTKELEKEIKKNTRDWERLGKKGRKLGIIQ